MKNNKILYTIIKLFIITACFIYIGYKFHNYQNKLDFYKLAHQINTHMIYFLAVILLMIVNWTTESIKWRFLIGKIQHIKFFKSIKAVYGGITTSMITPNRVGDIAGRVLSLNSDKRKQAIFSTIIGSISQFTITIVMGSIAMIILFTSYTDITGLAGFTQHLIILIFTCITIGTFILYYYVRIFEPFIKRRRWLSSIHEATGLLSEYSPKELTICLAFSLIRYAVFIIQYYFLFHIFGVQLELPEVFIIVSSTYLVSTLVPSYTLTEFGIRGSVIIFFTGLFYPEFTGAFISSVLLWMINLALPAIIGSFFVARIKI